MNKLETFIGIIVAALLLFNVFQLEKTRNDKRKAIEIAEQCHNNLDTLNSIIEDAMVIPECADALNENTYQVYIKHID